jgi:alpha-beta hydrolase superfamily lysophospholipase
MSDSPYSLRGLGETLQARGYHVLALRLPGHGTIPAGLTRVRWQDMAAAVRMAMSHLASSVGDRPIHIIGYSTGAPLALDHALEVVAGNASVSPASLVLISPAIGISPAAGLAVWRRRLSLLPGMSAMAWLSIEPEYDPYKYNSFATNAAEQVHALTKSVAARIANAEKNATTRSLPPVLVLKSTVDATVSNTAVVDKLLNRLDVGRHELVLFDINRSAIMAPLLVANPGPMTPALLRESNLPFTLTIVSNASENDSGVSAYRKAARSPDIEPAISLGLEWPGGVVSLSHVALPFPPDDPIYGRYPPVDKAQIFLGDIPLKGERGMLRVSPAVLLRLRYNPFYSYLEERVLDWIEPTS